MKYFIHELDKLFFDIAKGKELSLTDSVNEHSGVWIEMTEKEYNELKMSLNGVCKI